MFGIVSRIRFTRALQRATALEAASKWAEARANYELVAAIDQFFPEAWRGSARCSMRLGDLSAAERALKRLLLLLPGDSAALLCLGQIAVQSNRAAEGVLLYRAALIADPSSAAAAHALAEMGHSREADLIASGFANALEEQARQSSHLADQVRHLSQRLLATDTALAESSARSSGQVDQIRDLSQRLAETHSGLAAHSDSIQFLRGLSQLVTPKLDQLDASMAQTRALVDGRQAGQIDALAGQVSRVLDRLSALRAMGVTVASLEKTTRENSARNSDVAEQIERLGVAQSKTDTALREIRGSVDLVPDLASTSARQEQQIDALLGHVTRALGQLSAFKAVSSVVAQMQAFQGEQQQALAAMSERLQQEAQANEGKIRQIEQVAHVAASELGQRAERLENELAAARHSGAEGAAALAALSGQISSRLDGLTAASEELLIARSRDVAAIRALETAIGETRTKEAAEALDRVAALEAQLNAQKGAAAEVEALLQRHNQTMDYLLGRMEFVRREMLYELQYGPPRGQPFGESTKAAPAIVSTDKVSAALRKGLRLNMGCGHIPIEGYINVDRRELPGVDIVAEIDDVPLEPDSVAEIYSAHLLEHFPQEELVRNILPYWRSLMRPGAMIVAVVPDGEKMMRSWVQGDYPFRSFREVLFGAQDYQGDFHFNMFTPDSLSQIFRDQGFVDVKIREAGRRNGECFEFEIEARKPAEPPRKRASAR